MIHHDTATRQHYRGTCCLRGQWDIRLLNTECVWNTSIHFSPIACCHLFLGLHDITIHYLSTSHFDVTFEWTNDASFKLSINQPTVEQYGGVLQHINTSRAQTTPKSSKTWSNCTYKQCLSRTKPFNAFSGYDCTKIPPYSTENTHFPKMIEHFSLSWNVPDFRQDSSIQAVNIDIPKFPAKGAVQMLSSAGLEPTSLKVCDAGFVWSREHRTRSGSNWSLGFLIEDISQRWERKGLMPPKMLALALACKAGCNGEGEVSSRKP